MILSSESCEPETAPGEQEQSWVCINTAWAVGLGSGLEACV